MLDLGGGNSEPRPDDHRAAILSTQAAYMFIVPCVPIVAAIGLRYLFAAFLRQSAACFADMTLPNTATLKLGTRIAVKNGLIFGLAALLFIGSTILDLPWPVTAAAGVFGVVTALVATIAIVRNALGTDVLPSGLIGLVTFTGGNVPLIFLSPAILAVAT